MKRTTKVVAALLACVMLIGAMVGCSKEQASGTPSTSPTAETSQPKENANFNATGLPIVNEKITLKGIAKQGSNVGDFNDMVFFEKVEEATNIHVDWEMVSSEGWNEKVSLLFASGTGMPDIIFGNSALTDAQVIQYGTQGLLLPMNDYTDKYAENITKLLGEMPNYWASATAPNGKIYALPSFHGIQSNSNSALFMNTAWLEKVGKKAPTTTDEFLDVLRAFKAAGDLNGNGVNDEVGFSFKYGDSVNGIYPLFGSFGRVDNAKHLLVEDEKVVFTAIEDSYKEAIKYFATMAAEGLMDVESFTQEVAVLWSKIQEDPIQVGASTFWTASWAAGSEEEANKWTAIGALKGPNGDQQWEKFDTSVFSLCSYAITSSCANPEAAFRYGDYMFNSEVAADNNFGPIGIIWDYDANGVGQFKETVDGKENTGDLRRQYAPLNYGIFANPPSTWLDKYSAFGATEFEKNVTLNSELYGPYQKDNYFPTMYMTEEEISTITSVSADILSYVNEKTANWILYGGVEKEWDSYVAELKKMGVEDYISVYQQAYNRYIGK